MSAGDLYIEGKLYLTLEVVAEVYEVKSTLLREVFDRGLLDTGVDQGASVCIAAVELDRVATIVRMHRVLGLDLDSIALRLS